VETEDKIPCANGLHLWIFYWYLSLCFLIRSIIWRKASLLLV